jgi:hypothetical protein
MIKAAVNHCAAIPADSVRPASAKEAITTREK